MLQQRGEKFAYVMRALEKSATKLKNTQTEANKDAAGFDEDYKMFIFQIVQIDAIFVWKISVCRYSPKLDDGFRNLL